MPTVDVGWFSTFTGITLGDDETTRVNVLLDRARRTVDQQIRIPDPLAGDDLLDYKDAVAEVAWYYWEAEKAAVMEVLAQPLVQLSIGGLFWTKDSNAGLAGGSGTAGLAALARVIQKWGLRNRGKISLEGELAYPD